MVYEPDGGVMEKGDYMLRFSFKLPEHLPSNMYFKSPGDTEEPKAKVKYYIKATLINAADPLAVLQMQYKQVLIVREQPMILKQNNAISNVHHVKTLRCFKRGHTKLTAKFNKNVFTPNELAEGEIRIDNSRCSIAIKTVLFQIEQVLT